MKILRLINKYIYENLIEERFKRNVSRYKYLFKPLRDFIIVCITMQQKKNLNSIF